MATRDAAADRRLMFYGEHEASLSLHLDGLPDDLAAHISVLPPRRLQDDLPQLAAAGLIVFVRGFKRAWRSGLIATLRKLGVPCAWFTDDDLAALRGEQPGFGFYTQAHLHDFASQMVALIGTTPTLCTRLAAFHSQTLHWPCILNERLLPTPGPRRPGPLRIAAVGGAFRAQGFRRLVLPALDALPGGELLLTDQLAPRISNARVIPFEPDFARFVATWRAAEPDILVHPPGATANLAMKGPGTLLTALYLGAAPIVADEPAYAGLGPAQGVLRAGETVESWRAALIQLAQPAAPGKHLARLLAHFRAEAPPDAARRTVEWLLSHAAPAGAASEARRAAALRLRWRPPLSLIWRARLRRLALSLASRSR